MRRLFIETNFLLEIAFDQRQADSCRRLLDAADAGEVQLVIPAFCLAEPLEPLGRRLKTRRRIQEELRGVLAELRRSTEYRERIPEADAALTLLVEAGHSDRQRLEDVVPHVAGAALIVPLDSSAVAEGFRLRRLFDLEPQDAFVLASVAIGLHEAGTDADGRGFVTTNTRDFDDPAVRDFLDARKCGLFTGFGEALGWVVSGAT